MADYPVIGDVSQTLTSVLSAGLSSLVPPPTVEEAMDGRTDGSVAEEADAGGRHWAATIPPNS
jgi:hypothetical protein